MAPVQYRPVDIVLPIDQTAVPKGDVNGRTIVTGDAAAPVFVEVVPPDLTAFGRSVYRSAGPTFVENQVNVNTGSRVVELAYVSVGAVLVNATPFYIIFVDENGVGAIAAGTGAVAPGIKVTAVGQVAVWEPPDGFLFTTGIKAIASASNVLYTALGAPEPLSATIRTRNP